MQEDLADDSIHTFEGHTAGVYAVAWSPTSDDLVASGGGDDRAFLWRVGEDAYLETQGAVHELTGHTDTVSALAFSKDGKLLATGGMDGCVRVWTVDEGRCMTTLEGPGDAVEWVRWHPKGTVVLAGCADFTVWMWNAQTGACMQVFSGHSGPVTCGGFSADGKLVVTGGGEGDASLRIWDPKTGECKFTLQGGHFHAAGLTALAFHPDAAVVLTGSEDGTSKIVALDTGRVINSLTGHEEDASLEAVAFLPGLPLAATAGLDGKLIVWDVASATSRVVCQHPEGIVRMICHHSQPLILTGCIDGAVRVWDARTGACSHTFGGHVEAVQDMALSPNGTLVLSGSEDGTVRVFSLVDT
jgi:angio-associated migratory cell protein